MDHQRYMERVKKIREFHRDKKAALYTVYCDKRKALDEEFEARMAALEKERLAPGSPPDG